MLYEVITQVRIKKEANLASQIADEPHLFAWGSVFVAAIGRDRDIFSISLIEFDKT